jgi:hypothetical protein
MQPPPQSKSHGVYIYRPEPPPFVTAFDDESDKSNESNHGAPLVRKNTIRNNTKVDTDQLYVDGERTNLGSTKFIMAILSEFWLLNLTFIAGGTYFMTFHLPQGSLL